MPTELTDKIKLAAQFVNSTNSHIFLTGKAGTGKTTFLHNLTHATHKKFVVVAPTGIAALNAKGVTIHSQFLLPLGTYWPGHNLDGITELNGQLYTQRDLARKNPLNSMRKQVLRDIDLLIIDEVSMLRADLLDAIDYRLKSVKGNFHKSFGGVQLLMIGDLYQLPPVVKDHEWDKLSTFYNSPHFFESKALQNADLVYIELDKIFRQQDEKFINILNNLRNNACTDADIWELNSHYQNGRNDDKDDIITITTHNYRADQMNQKALNDLPGKTFTYEAEIEGDFPAHLYPLPETLELKKDAQIMFVKNDPVEGKFYNGKLARVEFLDGDSITVVMAGEGTKYTLERMDWENVRYEVNQDTKDLEEHVTGTFTQFPIKLAWAITVHKSQGLTFDKAVIDVGRAFAPGQVYVALSRLRSLDGLVLHTRIHNSVISCDDEVVSFSGSHENQHGLFDLLKSKQSSYLHQLLHNTFDFDAIVKQINYTQGGATKKMVFEDDEMQNALDNLRDKLMKERNTTIKFRTQIDGLLRISAQQKLMERIQKGSAYYLDFLYQCLHDVLKHLEEVKQFSRTKKLQNSLNEIDQMITKKIEELQKAVYLTECILTGKIIEKNTEFQKLKAQKRSEIIKKIRNYVAEHPKNTSTKSGRKRKKGETYKETYKLVNEGLNVEEIAKTRNLAVTTIEGHLAKGVAAGEINISDFMNNNELKMIETEMKKDVERSLSKHFESFGGKVSYGKLRMVQAYLKRKESDTQ